MASPKRAKLSVKGQVFIFCFLLLALCAISPTVRFYVLTVLEYPIHYKEYKHFGIKIPSNYKIHGIDVSRYQDRIDWERVKKMQVGNTKLHFVFIKATEGTNLVDSQFERNWVHASKQKMVRGAYHFFRPNFSPKDQAILFAKMVKLSAGDLPPVVDIEEECGMTVEQVRKYTKQFLEMLKLRYGVKPILYTNQDFYKRHFANQADFDGYPLWIAHYHVNELELPDDRDWRFWQHSDRGNVNGINSDVDFNVFEGDSAEFQRLLVP